MPENRAYRVRAVPVEAVQWTDHDTSCGAVYAFLGLDVGPHHHHNTFKVPGGTSLDCVWPGGWIIRYPDGRIRAASDTAFQAEFETAGEPETFTWGESISTTGAGATVYIPVNHGGNYSGDVVMPHPEAVVLRDMLDDLVSERRQAARDA